MTSFKVYDFPLNIRTIEVDNSLPYLWRTYDGSENNLINPTIGMANTNLIRINQNDTFPTRTVPPRLISNTICQGTSVDNEFKLSNMMWVWGQFLDHEIDLTPDNSGESWNMTTDDGGPTELYPGRTILFTRSAYNIIDGKREHPNIISSFIDGTNVYGTDITRVMALRRLDGTGKMKTVLADNSEILMGYNTNGLSNAPNTMPSFFLAGDIRANENVLLTAIHTLFVREHNRICDLYMTSNPEFKDQDEMIYQYARRKVIGIMQNITYEEFLPALLGESLPNYTTYDSTVSAATSIEFSTVGYRLGHSMLSSNLQIGNTTSFIELKDAFFNPSYVQTNGINNLLIGAVLTKMQAIDPIIIEDVRSFLFEAPTLTNLLDLASLNIQRGRDHNIPGYNTLRQAYGLSTFTTFNDLPMDIAIRAKLESLYPTVNDIDPWIGMLCESHPLHPVGPLTKAILVEQFTRFRTGDRYYFEYDSSLSEQDKNSIRSTTLASLIYIHTGYVINSGDAFRVD